MRPIGSALAAALALLLLAGTVGGHSHGGPQQQRGAAWRVRNRQLRGKVRFDFEGDGGARNALGLAKLRELKTRNGWAGSVNQLAEELDKDEDLVSFCAGKAINEAAACAAVSIAQRRAGSYTK